MARPLILGGINMTIDEIKSRIKALYETNPQIHMNVTLSRPKVNLQNDAVTIKGVYPHVFIIEEYSKGTPHCHTLQYVDVFTKRIEILELENE